MIDALFGSKTRVKLLHLFLNNPNRAFYVREITRKIDEQINSVRRELANMLSIGIIQSDSSNNRLYYEVNQNYAYYEPLKAIFGDSDHTNEQPMPVAATDWGKRLKALGDVRVALLSGSLVRGSGSELDVLLAGNVNKTQLKRFIKQMEDDEGHSLNYTVMPYEEFYYRLSIKDRFIINIINSKFTLLQDTEHVLSEA
ncbi:MAG TPA: transcriptional regulator [Candidatus Saccharimonadales bacterium]|nr:transcriptional regulator [Candidatus Saccharimonadales bacterium]